MKRADFCIIGLGRFGMQVAHSLKENNFTLVLIDNDQHKTNTAAQEFDHVVCCDGSNLTALAELQLEEFSAVIVGVTNIEASIMICANLRELGQKNIIARAKNEVHNRVLRTMGIREALIPEKIVGKNLVIRLIHGMETEIINLGNDILFVRAPVNNKKLFNRTLGEINIREHTNANLISIMRNGKDVVFPLGPNTPIQPGDVITAVCQLSGVNQYLRYINPNDKNKYKASE